MLIKTLMVVIIKNNPKNIQLKKFCRKKAGKTMRRNSDAGVFLFCLNDQMDEKVSNDHLNYQHLCVRKGLHFKVQMIKTMTNSKWSFEQLATIRQTVKVVRTGVPIPALRGQQGPRRDQGASWCKLPQRGNFWGKNSTIFNKTRSSWINCALRGDEAVHWVIRQQWLVLGGTGSVKRSTG